MSLGVTSSPISGVNYGAAALDHANLISGLNTAVQSIVHTIGNQHFVPYSEVFLTQGLLVCFQ